METLFPVLIEHKERAAFLKDTGIECPPCVRWEWLLDHREQAVCNHSQTLSQLASRGGLSPSEMVAVWEDRPWKEMSLYDAVRRLRELVHLAAGGE